MRTAGIRPVERRQQRAWPNTGAKCEHPKRLTTAKACRRAFKCRRVASVCDVGETPFSHDWAGPLQDTGALDGYLLVEARLSLQGTVCLEAIVALCWRNVTSVDVFTRQDTTLRFYHVAARPARRTAGH